MMAVWATVFIETWKKRQDKLFFEWDLAVIKEKDSSSVRREFRYLHRYDSDVDEIMKSDCANEGRMGWYALYGFVMVFLLGGNIMACLLKEGVFDAELEEPFTDAIAVMSSPVFLSDGMISTHMETSI